MFHLTVCSWSSHWSVQDYLQQNGGLHCRHRQSTGINPSSSFDRQLYVVSQFNVFFATAENRSKISTLHTWRSQGWKSSSMNSHCTKRKYSWKDMNWERYFGIQLSWVCMRWCQLAILCSCICSWVTCRNYFARYNVKLQKMNGRNKIMALWQVFVMVKENVYVQRSHKFFHAGWKFRWLWLDGQIVSPKRQYLYLQWWQVWCMGAFVYLCYTLRNVWTP